MLLTPAAVPFVAATGQSTTTAPAGRFRPPFARRTWFIFTPFGKTFKGKVDIVAEGAAVVEIAPKVTFPEVGEQSPELPRGIPKSAVSLTPLFSCYKKVARNRLWLARIRNENLEGFITRNNNTEKFTFQFKEINVVTFSGSSSTEVALLSEALDEFLLIEDSPESGLGVFLSGRWGDHWLIARRDWTASKSTFSLVSLWQPSPSECTEFVSSWCKHKRA